MAGEEQSRRARVLSRLRARPGGAQAARNGRDSLVQALIAHKHKREPGCESILDALRRFIAVLCETDAFLDLWRALAECEAAWAEVERWERSRKEQRRVGARRDVERDADEQHQSLLLSLPDELLMNVLCRLSESERAPSGLACKRLYGLQHGARILRCDLMCPRELASTLNVNVRGATWETLKTMLRTHSTTTALFARAGEPPSESAFRGTFSLLSHIGAVGDRLEVLTFANSLHSRCEERLNATEPGSVGCVLRSMESAMVALVNGVERSGRYWMHAAYDVLQVGEDLKARFLFEMPETNSRGVAPSFRALQCCFVTARECGTEGSDEASANRALRSASARSWQRSARARGLGSYDIELLCSPMEVAMVLWACLPGRSLHDFVISKPDIDFLVKYADTLHGLGNEASFSTFLQSPDCAAALKMLGLPEPRGMVSGAEELDAMGEECARCVREITARLGMGVPARSTTLRKVCVDLSRSIRRHVTVLRRIGRVAQHLLLWDAADVERIGRELLDDGHEAHGLTRDVECASLLPPHLDDLPPPPPLADLPPLLPDPESSWSGATSAVSSHTMPTPSPPPPPPPPLRFMPCASSAPGDASSTHPKVPLGTPFAWLRSTARRCKEPRPRAVGTGGADTVPQVVYRVRSRPLGEAALRMRLRVQPRNQQDAELDLDEILRAAQWMRE